VFAEVLANGFFADAGADCLPQVGQAGAAVADCFPQVAHEKESVRPL